MAALVFIYKRIFHGSVNWLEVKAILLFPNAAFMGVAIALMPFNYIIEAIKWRELMKSVQVISVGKAMSSVFMGVCTGIFTPNRIGECIGRSLNLNQSQRTQSLALATVSSFTQTLVTVLAGITGIYFTGFMLSGVTVSFQYVILFVCVLIIIVLLVYFLTVKFPETSESLIKMIRLFFNTVMENIGRNIIYILSLSALRYLLFSFQYYLILKAFGINLDLKVAIPHIAIVFLFVTALPTAFLAELPVRTSVAITVLGALAGNDLAVASSSVLLWMINVAFPALIGAVVLYKQKLE